MSMLETIFFSVIAIAGSKAFITRTPCRYSANFTKNAGYFSGEIGRVLKNVNESRCASVCMSNSSCLYFNYEITTGRCEIIVSHEGELEKDKVTWNFYSTNYDTQLRGPLCKYLNVTCVFEEYCEDTCTPPGWKIKLLGDIAEKKVTTCTSQKDGIETLKKCSKLNDGEVGTYEINFAAKRRISIDLGQKYWIQKFIIVIKGKYNYAYYDVYIDEQRCTNSVHQTVKVVYGSCDKPLYGQKFNVLPIKKLYKGKYGITAVKVFPYY